MTGSDGHNRPLATSGFLAPRFASSLRRYEREALLAELRSLLGGYGRGHISVLARAGLEHRARECYAVVKREHLRPHQGPSRAGDGLLAAALWSLPAAPGRGNRGGPGGGFRGAGFIR